MVPDAEVRALIGALPRHSFVRNYVEWAETQTASPLAYHLGMSLSLVGLTAPSSHVASGFLASTFTNAWVLAVGDSGTQKTLAVNLALRLLVDAQIGRLVAPDPTTEEALLKYLEAQPTQLYCYPEGGSFLANTTGSVGNYRSKIRAAFTEWYDCIEKSRVDAKGNEHKVHNPRLSIIIACTPRHLEDFTTLMDWEGGFVGRFCILFAKPERTLTQRADNPELRNWLRNWLAVSAGHPRSPPGGDLTPEAQVRWDAWCAEMRPRVEQAAPRVAPLLRRADMVAAKAATIFARDVYAVGGKPWPIGLDVLEPAIALAEMHIRSAIELSKSIASSDEQRELLATYNAIGPDWRARGAVSLGAQLVVGKVEKYMKTLVEQGRIETAEQAGVPYARRVPNGAPREWIANYVPVAADPPPPVSPAPAEGAGIAVPQARPLPEA